MLSTIGREVVASMGGGGLRMLLLHFSLKNAVFVPFPTFESIISSEDAKMKPFSGLFR